MMDSPEDRDRTPATSDLVPEHSTLSVDATVGLGEGERESIGPYRILQKIGEGGFGVVYLAEQTEPVRRRVALKVIKPGMDSKAVIARFEQERQALAVMDHPNVARVLDAGTTERGLPYFAMEYVKGEPITQYCDRHILTIRQRLELFARVCDAVQHAHMKGIIHRDIKPNNVLVSVSEASPNVKVIDFGVAKAISHTLTQETIFTQQGQLIGTPEYMSPEQAEMGATDIDTRTDVYSLGVLLYELLIGATPFDAKTLRAGGYAQVQRMIREIEPPKPSTRLSSLGEESAAIAKHRRLKREELLRELSRELDWIPLKAMRKDRTERYRTASDLAEDVQRYLDGEPLEAGPEAATYRLRKFVRRNKGPVVAVAAVMIVLIAGMIGTTWGWYQAQLAKESEAEQRKIAEREMERALVAEAEAERRSEEHETVVAFLERLLSDIDTVTMGIDLRTAIVDMDRKILEQQGYARQEAESSLNQLAGTLSSINFTDVAIASLQKHLFDRALTEVDEQFADQPAVKARLFQIVATTLRELGLYERSIVPQKEALAIRRQLLGDGHPDTLDSVYNMGVLLLFDGKIIEAEPFVHEAAYGLRNVHGAKHPETLVAINSLGILKAHQGKFTEAERHYREALDGFRVVHGMDHARTLGVLGNIGMLLQSQERYSEAMPYLREALAGLRRVLGKEHRWTLNSMSNTGFLLQKQGKFEEAESYFREALKIGRRTLGDEHPHTLTSISHMGGLLRDLGELEKADRLGAEAVETAKRTLPEGHLHTAVFLNEHARTLAALERFTEAEERMLEAVAIFEQSLSTRHNRTLENIEHLIDVYDAWHEHEPGMGHDATAAQWRAKLEALAEDEGV